MPIYSPDEQRNIDVTHRLFDTSAKEDKSLLFTENAVWWNGLPFVGAPGQTEHRGRDAIRGIRPIATMTDVPPIELPPSIDLSSRGRVALDQLKTRLAGVRDEVQRCVDEDVRLRAEIEALVEVDRLAPR